MSDTTKFVLNAAAVVVIALALIRLTFIESVVVRDNGMAPTLVFGDEVLVWKDASVERGDVVVCEHPARDGVLVIGRAVAFPGQTIRTDHNGALYVGDDRPVMSIDAQVRFQDVTRKRLWDMQLGRIDYGSRETHAFFRAKGVPFRLPSYTVEKGVYLLGDNHSEEAFDSRAFGEIEPERCLGEVMMRLKPGPARGDELTTGYLELID